MYVVAGVSGNTGAVVARELLERGAPVRVVVREESKAAAWRAKGAQVAVASLDDARALAGALEGARGAYLLSPPHPVATDYLAASGRVTDALAEAVRLSGVPHVVFLSSIAAHRPEGTGPIVSVHQAERKLTAAARALTLLRPGYFLENWAASLASVKQDGVLPSFIPPSRTLPMVSTRDIGRVAAHCLLEPVASGHRIVELAGPRDYSPEDVARALEGRLGRAVKVAPAPLEAVVPAFMSWGMSEDVGRLYRELYAAIPDGRLDHEGSGPLVHGEVTPENALSVFL